MAIGFIIGVIIVLLLVFALIAMGTMFKKGRKTGGKVAAVIAVCLFLSLIFVPTSIHTVDTGEIAVVKHLGEARGVRTAGTYFDFWVTNTYQIYDSKVQNVEITTATYSSDAQTMDIEMTLQYQIMSDKVTEIAKQYGSLELLQNRIESIAIEKSKAILSSHKAMNIIADRAAMSPAVELAIKNAIGDEYYVNVTAVVLTNIDFSDAFENAVEEKMIAEQKQLKAEYENQTKIAQAEADAKAKLVEADASAKVMIVSAEAEAESHRLLEESLTEKILKEMYIEKWDGKLPQVMDGEQVDIMIPMGEITE